MKIALVSFEYPPETGFGGIGTYTWYQARGLAKIGHDVHVLAGATSPTPLSTRTSDHGVTVHRFQAGGALMKAFAALNRHRLWWSKSRLQTGLSMYRGLTALADKHQFDVIEFPECGGDGW